MTAPEEPPAGYTQYIGAPSAPPPPAYYPPQPAPPPAAPAAPNPLDQLMGPVALYPDPLISILLPASTFPGDIQSAGAYLAQGGDPTQVDGQPWDQSVRALAHYPQVVTWMAQNMPWTQAVGAAFVASPAQVMEAIQRLRELAQAAGTLASSPQQQVIVESSYVEIMPAQPGVIYVPQYDPQVVYVDQPYYDYHGPYCTYGPAYTSGAWLTFGANWHGGGVVVVDQGYWGDNHGWRRDPYAQVNINININVNDRPRPWAFPPGRPRPQAPSNWRSNTQIVNVRVIVGAPPHPPQAAYRDIHTRGPAAVAVVSRNPAAFKGRPINPAILPRQNPPAPHGSPSTGRPQGEAPRPASGNSAGYQAPRPAGSPATPARPATPSGYHPEAAHSTTPPRPAPAAAPGSGTRPVTTPYKETPARPVESGRGEITPAKPLSPKPDESRAETPARPNTAPARVAPVERGPNEPREEVRPNDGKEPAKKDPKKVVKPTPEKRDPDEKRPDDNQH